MSCCPSAAPRPARLFARPRFRIVRVHQHADGRRLGHELAQQLQPLRPQHAGEKAHAGDVAARPVEAGDEAVPDRIAPGREDDRNRRGRGLGRERRNGCSPTITATGRRIRSAASAGSRSDLICPPSDIRSRRSGPRQSRLPSGPGGTRSRGASQSASDVLRRNPTTGIAGCCARAASGHAAAAPPRTPRNSRRLMSAPRLRRRHRSGSNEYFDRG